MKYLYILCFAIIWFSECSWALVRSSRISKKPCDEVHCIPGNECPTYVDLIKVVNSPGTSAIIKNETRINLRNAYCGKNYANKVKICCSLLERINKRKPRQLLEEEGNIEDHPNLNLLPRTAESGSSTDCGKILRKGRIINGVEAKLREFPWMALLIYDYGGTLKFECGGSVINAWYVLTAAHCLNDNLILARIGEHDITKEKDCELDGTKTICNKHIREFVVKWMIYPDKYVGLHNYDIGLLRLEKMVKLKEPNFGFICLPLAQSLREFKTASANATVAGWGVTEEDMVSNTLKNVDINILSMDDCQKHYGSNFSKKLCAGLHGKDSCSGDSGGPLMIRRTHGVERYYEYGIVSYGPYPCGIGDIPAVYTDVTKYLKWILDNIEP